LKLIQVADNLFSKLARISRADKNGKVDCICCGRSFHWAAVDPAHFIGRACMALRWHIDNVWPCCRACHELPNHLDRYETTLIKTRGKAFVDDLVIRGKEYQKAPNEGEIKEIIQELTYKLSFYGDQNSIRNKNFSGGDGAI
jgi:hypothetical protein